jgi:hypothetical protein
MSSANNRQKNDQQNESLQHHSGRIRTWNADVAAFTCHASWRQVSTLCYAHHGALCNMHRGRIGRGQTRLLQQSLACIIHLARLHPSLTTAAWQTRHHAVNERAWQARKSTGLANATVRLCQGKGHVWVRGQGQKCQTLMTSCVGCSRTQPGVGMQATPPASRGRQLARGQASATQPHHPKC